MRNILIATGIFPPAIGGPALYSQKLAEEFSASGAEVSVITYGGRFAKSDRYGISGVSLLWPYGIRQFIYFVRLLAAAKKSDMILAFDSLGAGLPAVLAGKLLRKTVIIRMGGDFLWEKYIASGVGREIMSEFYEKNLHTDFPLLFRLIRFVLRNSHKVAFTTEFQRNLFIPAYGLIPDHCVVAGNVFEKETGASPANSADGPRTILWAGRFIRLKNLEFLLKVFKKLSATDKNMILKLIGDGPERRAIAVAAEKEGMGSRMKIVRSMDEESLKKEISDSYFCILPSLSDISPNFALKCLSLNKPIVLTQETGIRNDFPGLMYADPRNIESFFLSALRLLDDNSYDNYQKAIANIRYRKTWKDLAMEYLELSEK